LLVVGLCLRRFRQPARLAQRFAQDVLDLRVEAAQLVVGPALRRGEYVGVDAQRIGLLRAHGRRPALRRAAKNDHTTTTTIALTSTTSDTTTKVARPRSSPAHHRPAAASRPITPTTSISRDRRRSSLAFVSLPASAAPRRSERAIRNAGTLDSANTTAAR